MVLEVFSYPTLQKIDGIPKEIGQYASRNKTTDIVHHHYVRLNGEIIHEEINLMPRTFHDVNVYVSNPWFPAAYGFIRLFRYRKYDNFCLNHCP